MKKILFLLLSTLLLVSSGAQSEGIFSKSKFDFLKDEPQLMPVDQAFVFDAQQQGNLVKISWVIADGYYLYQSKFRFLSDTAGVEFGDPSLPPAEPKNDPVFGEVQIYRDQVTIDLPLGKLFEIANDIINSEAKSGHF